MASSGIKARLGHAQWSLKPQDLAMALKLVCRAGEKVIYTDLARAMHMSQFEAHACLARLSAARLLTEVGGAPALVLQQRLREDGICCGDRVKQLRLA